MSQSLDDALAVANEDDYDLLPEPIKCAYTREQYLWLSDAQKATLIQDECEPEW